MSLWYNFHNDVMFFFFLIHTRFKTFLRRRMVISMKRWLKLLTCMILAISCTFLFNVGIVSAKGKTITIGNKNDADYSIKIKNEIGQPITSIQIKTKDAQYWSENYLKEDQKIKNKKSCKFYYTLQDGETDDTQFILDIILEDGSEYALSSFPMNDINKKMSLKDKDDIVYIEYKDTDKKLVSTYETEKQAKLEAEQAEQQAAQQAAEQQQVSQQNNVQQESSNDVNIPLPKEGQTEEEYKIQFVQPPALSSARTPEAMQKDAEQQAASQRAWDEYQKQHQSEQ